MSHWMSGKTNAHKHTTKDHITKQYYIMLAKTPQPIMRIYVAIMSTQAVCHRLKTVTLIYIAHQLYACVTKTTTTLGDGTCALHPNRMQF